MAPRSQSKARPAPVRPAPVVQPPVVQPAPVNEEDIDLDNVSEMSDKEDTPPAPPNIPGDAMTHSPNHQTGHKEQQGPRYQPSF